MNTHELINRFLDGETTVEEERLLCRRFQESSVPPELKPYAEFFRDMATLPVSDVPRHAHLRAWRWVAAAAVVAAFVVGGAWLHVRQDSQLLAKTYAGSYMLVDGKRVTDEAKVKDAVGTLLADANRIEDHSRPQQVIDAAEQEVLDGVPAGQRKELERLLSE